MTVFFKDQTDNPRIINVTVMPMALSEEQSDPCLDDPKVMKKRGKRPPARKRITK